MEKGKTGAPRDFNENPALDVPQTSSSKTCCID
jgi:hypothetical protein